MSGGKVLWLVHAYASDDVVRALEYLLAQAKAGHVIGLAWIAMHKSYDYSVDIAGETKRSPTLTRGMLHLLDDQLSEIIRKDRL